MSKLSSEKEDACPPRPPTRKVTELGFLGFSAPPTELLGTEFWNLWALGWGISYCTTQRPLWKPGSLFSITDS